MLVCFHRQLISQSNFSCCPRLRKTISSLWLVVIVQGVTGSSWDYYITKKLTRSHSSRVPSWSASRDPLLALKMWLQNFLLSVSFICRYCSVEGFWLWNKPTKRPTSANEIKTPLIIGKSFELFLLQSCHRIRNRSRKIPDRDYYGF